jgi:hypothetical protein
VRVVSAKHFAPTTTGCWLASIHKKILKDADGYLSLQARIEIHCSSAPARSTAPRVLQPEPTTATAQEWVLVAPWLGWKLTDCSTKKYITIPYSIGSGLTELIRAHDHTVELENLVINSYKNPAYASQA